MTKSPHPKRGLSKKEWDILWKDYEGWYRNGLKNKDPMKWPTSKDTKPKLREMVNAAMRSRQLSPRQKTAWAALRRRKTK